MKRARMTLALLAVALVLGLGAVYSGIRVAAAHDQPDTIRTEAGCKVRVHRWIKEDRCIACIKRGGHFHKRGAATGFCHK